MTPVTAPADTRLYQSYLKGEPKALGTVQIMIGVMTLLFGIVLMLFALSPAIVSGITVWGSLIFIIAGALSVAAANRYNSCVVKASLGMNVFSAVAAGIAVILFAVDMVFGSVLAPWCRRYYNSHYYDGHYDRYYSCDFSSLHMWNGIYGVLLVFSVLQFAISISTSVFACKATCTGTTPIYSQPMHTQTMYSQPMYSQPMNSQPMYPQPMYPQPMHSQPMNSQPMNPQPTNSQPMDSPPMDSPPMYNPAVCNKQMPTQA